MDENEAKIAKCQQNFYIFKAKLEELMSHPLEETMAGLSPFEQAKLKTTIAYSIFTLHRAFQKTKGENEIDRKYLNRIHEYYKKIDEIQEKENK